MIEVVRADRAAARPPLSSTTAQSVAKDGISRDVSTPHGAPLTATFDGRRTLYEAWRPTFERLAERPCLGVREVKDGTPGPYAFESYGKIWQRCTALATGFVRLAGVTHGGKIGINMRTRAEWTMSMIACAMQGVGVATLYDTFGAPPHLLPHLRASFCVCLLVLASVCVCVLCLVRD